MLKNKNEIILGIDPGLRNTGWGLIESNGIKEKHIDNGVVKTVEKLSMEEKLKLIYNGVTKIIKEYKPNAIAVEKIFVNINPESSLKLGQARGIIFLVAGLNQLKVSEYSPNNIKKNLVGYGHASKLQIKEMLKIFFPNINISCEDSADAIAVAICHSMQSQFYKKIKLEKT